MNVIEALEELSVPFDSHGESSLVTDGWVGVVCPWCGTGTDKKGLGIHLSSLACSCWKCGKHSAVDALAELTGRRWSEIKTLLGGARMAEPGREHKGTLRVPQGIGPLLRAHRDYLTGRGFDPDELVGTWGIGGIGLAPTHAWSIFVPIEHENRTVSWTTRTLSGQGKRWMTAPEECESVPAKSILYGERYSQGRSSTVVVEGCTSAWAVGPGVTATLGLGFTTAQVKRIAAFPVRWILFDQEREAQRRARQLCKELSSFPGKTGVIESDAADPGEASERELRQIRKLLR
jgi:hypothetical protein